MKRMDFTEMNPAIVYAPEQRCMTLEEYLGQTGEKWFRTAKTKRTMQAMMVSRETTFENAFEAVRYTVQDDGETVVLKGSCGEMLAGRLAAVISTYMKPDGSRIRADDFALRDRAIDIVTRTDPGAYFAMHIPAEISVTTVTSRGDVLHSNLPNTNHGSGDYLVCRADEKGCPDLSDVWILNGNIFPAYYEAGGTDEDGTDVIR